MSKIIDLSGKRFGHLVVVNRASNNKRGEICWNCQCDCGKTKVVSGIHLRDGHTTSCGCCNCIGKNFIDITGETFGNLLVIKRMSGTNNTVKWLCQCTLCGNTYEVNSYTLRHGKANPCPCTRKSFDRENSPTFIHGDSHTRLHNIWTGMLNRCRNPKVKRYECYGGRGITVCDEWHNYLSFKKWALSNGYAPELSIDRINVDGNYEPSNCRWITMREQAANRRPRKKSNVMQQNSEQGG